MSAAGVLANAASLMRQCGRSAQEQDGQQDGQQSQQQQEGQQKEQQKAQQHARPSSGSAEHASAAADASRCLQALVKGDSTLQVALLENVHCLPALAAMLGQSQAAAAALALLQVLASSGTPGVQQLVVVQQPAMLQRCWACCSSIRVLVNTRGLLMLRGHRRC